MGRRVPLKVVTIACLSAACALTLGCAPVLQERELPALADQGKISRVAVAPFTVREGVGGSDVAAHQVAQALSETGLQVVPPSDVATAMGASKSPPQADDAAGMARLAAREFGAQAILLGRVDRYRGLDGSSLGASSPASVSFNVTLVSAPSGEPLWKATFDETQHPLSDNVFNAFRYPDGGSRWLTAPELVRWGASAVAKDLPTGE
ncbi:MAG TPA: hypothetical protein VMW35_06725 [Myxococcota bacterium]|jgi:hypothetical protein|nr:hypothetical protein [Myxococcota bacterium]